MPLVYTRWLYCSAFIECFFSLERPDAFQNPNRSLVVKACTQLGMKMVPLPFALLKSQYYFEKALRGAKDLVQ